MRKNRKHRSEVRDVPTASQAEQARFLGIHGNPYDFSRAVLQREIDRRVELQGIVNEVHKHLHLGPTEGVPPQEIERYILWRSCRDRYPIRRYPVLV